MKLHEFADKYDYPGSVILLEGKRDVPEADQPALIELGTMLAKAMKQATFRSGNANGADLFLSRGVASIDPKRLEVVIPFDGHRSKSNMASRILSLDDVNLSDNTEIITLSALNKKTADLLKRYVAGERSRFTTKVAFIIRDSLKVVGTSDWPPVSFGIFYDNLQEPATGGTGHTMSVCKQKNVPYIDQTTWMKWLA